jgi:transposase
MVKCTKRQIRELKTALRWKISVAQRERIQMVLLRESRMTQPAIADAMGVSLSTVNRANMAYDGGGIKALKPKPIGGRQRENMTLSEEKALLARFSKAVGAGEMLNIHDLKEAYEQAMSAVQIDVFANKLGGDLRPRPMGSPARSRAVHPPEAWWALDGLDGVMVFNKAGVPIGRVELPERCANVCFGGYRKSRLFMAASRSIMRCGSAHPGRPEGDGPRTWVLAASRSILLRADEVIE